MFVTGLRLKYTGLHIVYVGEGQHGVASTVVRASPFRLIEVPHAWREVHDAHIPMHVYLL